MKQTPRKVNRIKIKRYGLNGNLINENERTVDKRTKIIKAK